jgi:hypothetical protein
MGREQIQRFLRARACFAAEAQSTTSASSIMPPTAPGGRKGGMCLVRRVVERHWRDCRLTSTITVCTDVSTDRVFHVWNRQHRVSGVHTRRRAIPQSPGMARASSTMPQLLVQPRQYCLFNCGREQCASADVHSMAAVQAGSFLADIGHSGATRRNLLQQILSRR